MSKDGWLPPGVTDADIDRACPGYDDEEPSMDHMMERLVERLERMLDKAEAELERLRADNKLLVERVLELELELNRGCR